MGTSVDSTAAFCNGSNAAESLHRAASRGRFVRYCRSIQIVDAVVIVDDAKGASWFVRGLSPHWATPPSAGRPWHAGRRPELALEAVEQVEEAHALPGAVTPSDSRLPEHSRLLEAEERLACALLGTSE